MWLRRLFPRTGELNVIARSIIGTGAIERERRAVGRRLYNSAGEQARPVRWNKWFWKWFAWAATLHT